MAETEAFPTGCYSSRGSGPERPAGGCPTDRPRATRRHSGRGRSVNPCLPSASGGRRQGCRAGGKRRLLRAGKAGEAADRRGAGAERVPVSFQAGRSSGAFACTDKPWRPLQNLK